MSIRKKRSDAGVPRKPAEERTETLGYTVAELGGQVSVWRKSVSDLSLFDIERGLHELFDAWQEATTPESLAEAEQAIQAYAAAEVRKVDGIRAYLRACDVQAAAAKAEAEAQTKRQRMWEARRDRLKAFCFDTMQSFGARKLEGQHGSLSIRRNGGLQPLAITPALVPDEFCDVTVTIPVSRWHIMLRQHFGNLYPAPLTEDCKISPRIPSNERIRAALAQPCARCGGTGEMQRAIPCDAPITTCPECNGTKTASVPGVRLEPRGESLVVR